MADLTPRDARRLWQAGELTILDCREQDEHAAQHVPGTLLLPMSELIARIEEVPSERPLAILCRSGNRSGQVADYLNQQGDHGEVANILGGILGWAADGLDYAGVPPT